ncbi:MAG: hypothetical protein Q8R47_01300 [Nanoarchaeota archaeon]|nr:hypothetical protein [Nanoarchaeota archaeon]
MFERGNPEKYTDPDGHIVPLVLFGAGMLIAGALITLIWAVKKIENPKPISTTEAADIGSTAASEIAPSALETVSPSTAAVANKGILPLQVALGTYDAGKSLLDKYLPEEEDKDSKKKMVPVVIQDVKGNTQVFLVREGTSQFYVSGGGGSGGGVNYVIIWKNGKPIATIKTTPGKSPSKTVEEAKEQTTSTEQSSKSKETKKAS